MLPLNQDSQHDKVDKVSHLNKRRFQPNKLEAPRGFKPSDIRNLTSSVQLSELDKTSNKLERESERAGQDAPLIVEIGSGKGMHSIQYAKANPTHRMISIERTKEKFTAFQKALTEMPLDNLEIVNADAIPYCVYALMPKSVDTFYLLYPNPEPKNPNQQWLNMPFFEFLLSRLKPNGDIIMATNIESYVLNAVKKAQEHWRIPARLSEVPVNSQRTHFEIKYLQRKETCWSLVMTKPDNYITHFDEWSAVISK